MKKSHAVGWALDAPTPAQLKEFFAQVESGRINKDRLQEFLRGKGVVDVSTMIADWQTFYQKFFGMDVDFSEVSIPPKREGFDRLIVVAQGFTLNQVFNVCQKNFPCWRYIEDLDKETKGRNDREPTEHYAIWVCDRKEADEELKNLSANDLKEKGIKGITLLERLLLELKYWDETNEHLDVKNVTLCSGSRSSDGDVPGVIWYGKLKVRWYSPRHVSSFLRFRAVVS